MNLCFFDIDGTLTHSNAIDDHCFVETFSDLLGIRGIRANWLEYEHQTDSGLAIESCQRYRQQPPDAEETARLQRRFRERLEPAADAEHPIQQIASAGRSGCGFAALGVCR